MVYKPIFMACEDIKVSEAERSESLDVNDNLSKVFENHRKSLEASYVYILNGQKLIKNAKNGPFWRVFENVKLAVKQCYQTSQF